MKTVHSSPPAFNGNQNIEAVEPFAVQPGAERQGSAITPAIKVGIKLQPISRGGSFQRSGTGGGRLVPQIGYSVKLYNHREGPY